MSQITINFPVLTLSGYSDLSFEERFVEAKKILDLNPSHLVLFEYKGVNVTVNSHTVDSAREQHRIATVFKDKLNEQPIPFFSYRNVVRVFRFIFS